MSEKDKIKPGKIKFLEAALPPMVAGEYQVFANHNVESKGSSNGGSKFDEQFDIGKQFSVSAPRFYLDPATIYSVYPPADSYGTYSGTLPHIVFNRKTLPWERTIDFLVPKGAEVKPPWLALLMIDEDEINKNKLVIGKASILDLLKNDNPNDTVYKPLEEDQLSPWEKKAAQKERASKEKEEGNKPVKDGEDATKEHEKTEYDVIDLPLDLFYKIAPNIDELEYLAHARQIDTGNKELTGLNAKGWFSVLVGNRLPAKNKRNTVILVSLEGYVRFLDEMKPGGDSSKEKIRLIVLSQWSFTERGLNFEELVNRIDNGHISKDGTQAKGASLYRVYKNKEGLNPEMKKAFDFGYVPINHEMRQGTKTVSWYRGPLVPAIIPNSKVHIYESADDALRFDENTGMLDVSYASAWQLGRLLALQDAEFSKLINNWKGNYKMDLLLRIARDLLKNNTESGLDFSEDSRTLVANDEENFKAALAKLESDELMKNLVMELWNLKISKRDNSSDNPNKI